MSRAKALLLLGALAACPGAAPPTPSEAAPAPEAGPLADLPAQGDVPAPLADRAREAALAGDSHVLGGPFSGLAWSSGVACTDPQTFGAWRGRGVDVRVMWVARDNWAQIANPNLGNAVSQHAAFPGQLSVGIGMLPEDKTGTFAECATGAYDQHFKSVGTNMVKAGRGDAIIRLGWEANGNWYAWSIGTGSPASYKACFQKQVNAIRSTAPKILIEWTMNKDSVLGTHSVSEAYPGDAHVDIVAVDFYDMWPAYPDATAWSKDYPATENGGPRGLGTWLALAKLHKKKLAIPEWGVVDKPTEGGGDNPFYIQKMFEFFKANAADIAYESYFNCTEKDPDYFMILPETNNPKAAAAYKALY